MEWNFAKSNVQNIEYLFIFSQIVVEEAQWVTSLYNRERSKCMLTNKLQQSDMSPLIKLSGVWSI